MLYTTGLRCSEAFGLNLNDVDLKQNLLFIHEGKFGKSRWVPVSPSTSAALQRYVKYRERKDPALAESPFFVTRSGRRLYQTDVTMALRRREIPPVLCPRENAFSETFLPSTYLFGQ